MFLIKIQIYGCALGLLSFYAPNDYPFTWDILVINRQAKDKAEKESGERNKVS